jgi:hypothetical protein
MLMIKLSFKLKIFISLTADGQNGCKGMGNKGMGGQRNGRTKEWRDRGMEGQRNGGTEEWRGKKMGGQEDEGRKILGRKIGGVEG